MNIWLRSLRAAWPAVAIAVVVCAWFLNKAFNIDDHVFLTMADHMLDDPLHPASVQISDNGRPPAWAAAGMWSGPVMPAMLVPAAAAGGAEWLAHLAQLIVLCLGIVATAALGLRLDLDDRGTRWAALLVVGSAGVLAMTMTCMPDIPTMAFGALGAERLVALRDRPHVLTWIGATVALALCLLSRQHGIVIFACMVPVLVGTWPTSVRALRDRAFLVGIAAMVAAVALVFVTYAAMRDPSIEDGLTAPTKIADLGMLRVNVANLPAQWVLTFPLGLVWLYLHGRRMSRSWWCWLAIPLGIFLAALTQDVHRHWDWMPWQAPVTALGTAVLVDALVDALRRRDVIDLGLAGWLLMALPVAIYSHLPAKYLVPSAPAMAVLIMRHVARRPTPPSYKLLGGIVAQNVVLAALIISADAAHAESGRTGGELVAKYVARGERVWFDGTWGFQWYATQAGARPVTTEEPRPRPGDIVVLGMENWIVKKWPNKTLLERREFDTPGGRIMLRPAGFYSNVAWGPLPWRWGSRPFTPVEVWRIEKTP